MEEIILSIAEAEKRAAEIKSAAQEKCSEILNCAENASAEIAKNSEDECRLYREKALKEAEALAKKNYDEALDKQRVMSKQYADSIIKNADGAASEAVGRITRGSR